MLSLCVLFVVWGVSRYFAFGVIVVIVVGGCFVSLDFCVRLVSVLCGSCWRLVDLGFPGLL